MLGVVPMSRIREFLRLLYKHEEILTYISQQPSQSISIDYLHILIRQTNAEFNETQVENLSSYLQRSDPPILSLLDDGTFVLATRVTDLLLWLSNKMYLVNDKIIIALVEEMREISEKISLEMNRPKINSHMIDQHLEAMWRVNSQLRDISDSNKRAIGTQTQELRDGAKDFETKQMMAQMISDYLEPMKELIDENSGVVNAMNEAELVLGTIKSLHTMKSTIKSKSARLSSELSSTSVALRKDHINALSTIQPFLDVYLKSHSDLVLGCNRALATMNEKGVSSLNIPSKIFINLRKQPYNIFSEHNFARCFQRLFSVDFEARDLSIHPIAPKKVADEIRTNQLTKLISNRDSIPDIMHFILNEYPDQSLSVCNKACVDILVKMNDFDRIRYGGIENYSRGNYQLEVARIELLG